MSTALFSTLALTQKAFADNHKGPQGHGPDSHKNDPEHELHRAAMQCVGAGRVCIEHCLEALAQGDKSFLDCLKVSREMIAICEATSELAAQHSHHLKAMAALCSAVCTECLKDCEKHEKEHPACKHCAEACRNAIQAAKKIMA